MADFENVVGKEYSHLLPSNRSLPLVLISFIAWILIKKLLSCGNKNNRNIPPSPPRLPIFGNLYQLGHLPHRSLSTLAMKHGPLMLLHLGSKPLLVISSASVAEEAIRTHDAAFSGKPCLISTNWIYNASKGMLALSYGSEWRKLRRIYVNNLLNKRCLNSFNSCLEEETLNLLEKVENCSSISTVCNLTEMFILLTTDVMCMTAFGKRFREMKQGKRTLETMDEIVRLLFKFTIGEFVPWLAWTNRLSGFNAEMDRICRAKDEVLDAGIREIMQECSKGASVHGHARKENIIEIMLGLSIEWDTIKAVVQDLFGAGTKSSATTLEWAMAELISHPIIMNKLQGEVRGIMQGKHDISNKDLEKMRYLKAVIKESMRMHPATPILPRATREDIDLMGFHVPKGTMTMFNLWAIGRDPSSWDQCDKFLPERFMDSSIDYRGFDFQFIPFGVGRRICPGMLFATSTLEYVLANLMHKFDWQLPGGTKCEELDMTEKSGITVGRNKPLIVLPTKCNL